RTDGERLADQSARSRARPKGLLHFGSKGKATTAPERHADPSGTAGKRGGARDVAREWRDTHTHTVSSAGHGQFPYLPINWQLVATCKPRSRRYHRLRARERERESAHLTRLRRQTTRRWST